MPPSNPAYAPLSTSDDLSPPTQPKQNPHLPLSHITISLPLSILTYTNIIYSSIYLALTITTTINKLSSFAYISNLQRGTLAPCLTVWTLSECFRLYYGVNGNTKEKVPQLSTFLLMTIFPQLPVTLYLALFQEVLFPFDRTFGVVMCVFLGVEVIVGYMALRGLIRRQTKMFYRLCQIEEENGVRETERLMDRDE